MARLSEEFDQSQVTYDPAYSGNFELLPSGRYRVQMIESQEVENSQGTGLLLKLTYEVLEGQYAKRRLWDNLNYRHQSPDAQRIAQESLKKLCESVGFTGVLRDTEVLHFKPITVYVTQQAASADGRYGPQNRINYIGTATAGSMQAPLQGQGVQGQYRGGSAAAQVAATRTSAPNSGARPWQQGGNAQPAQQAQSPRQAAQPAPQQAMDDEIPF